MAEKFTSHLKVDKKIVSLLSKSTYQKSFSYSLRELISNSYDADSLSVHIEYDKEFSYIEVSDDGNGMSQLEFDRYLTIAGTKQENQFTRKYKRKKIGQFGVGFLSIFPFCESLQIITTTENSNNVLKAIIPTKDYFETSSRKNKGDSTVEEILVEGIININPSQRLEHFTKIRLINPTQIVKQYFSRPNTKKRDSIYTWSPEERFKWELQEDLPISLPKSSKYYSGYNFEETIGLEVFLNKVQLFRNDYFGFVLEKGEEKFGEIICNYIFTTDYKSIKPLESRGIKLRVNNVGIGARTDFQLKRDRGFSRLHWISGEIFFSEQIKEHLNISREDFISTPIIDTILEYFAEKLRNLATEVESIDESEKGLTNISNHYNRLDATKPKYELIKANLKRLESRGFEIVKSNKLSKSTNSQKFQVDKLNKRVYIPETEEAFEETITIFNKNYQLTYDKWDLNSDFPGCRRVSKKVIEINQNYPLFKSKSLGNTFKRIHIMLLIASEDTRSSNQFYDYIIKNFLTEFENFI